MSLALTLAGPACGGGDKAPQRLGEITVFAAASLTEAFEELGKAFEAARSGSKVTFSFGASSSLAQQIRQGAPADVVATADEASLKALVDAGTVLEPRVFASNRLELAVGKGNPKGLSTLQDLEKPGVVFVMCAHEVPCGRSAAQALAKAAITALPKSFEENVKAVLTKVELGEADAGIVYVTDVRSSGGKVEGVPIPDNYNVPARYPMAIVRRTRNLEGARVFADFVLSDAGRRLLDRYGFLPPVSS